MLIEQIILTSGVTIVGRSSGFVVSVCRCGRKGLSSAPVQLNLSDGVIRLDDDDNDRHNVRNTTVIFIIKSHMHNQTNRVRGQYPTRLSRLVQAVRGLYIEPSIHGPSIIALSST